MSSCEERLVPKVHPATREVEADDPMELIATPVEGDPDWMLDCIVQEYAWMGWRAEDLLALFRDPMYPVLNQLREHFGDEEVRRRVQSLLGRGRAVHVQEVIDDEPEPDEDELIQLTIRRRDGG